jgi:hypothetical protein
MLTHGKAEIAPFVARKASHAASVGRKTAELLGAPMMFRLEARSPELICRVEILATPSMNWDSPQPMP